MSEVYCNGRHFKRFKDFGGGRDDGESVLKQEGSAASYYRLPNICWRDRKWRAAKSIVRRSGIREFREGGRWGNPGF